MQDARPAEAAGHVPSSGTPGVASAGGLATALVAKAAQLQDDLRVLVGYVAGRADRPALPGRLTLGPGAAAGSGPVSYVPDGPDFHADLLVLSPEAIARDGALLERLYTALDALSRLAAPADVASIRLTRAFVEGAADSEAPPRARAAARRLRRWAWASAGFGLLVFFIVVALLVHVDQGRRVVQQLKEVRREYQAVMQDFAVARAAAPGMPETAGPAACRDAAAGASAETDARVPCDRLRDVLLRMDAVYRELMVWNTISERLAYASPITWLAPRRAPAEDGPARPWRPTELRTSVMITSLTGFVLPMLLGLLGACVYVYREIDGQIEASTLRAREAVHGTLRMLLGAILGGLLGAIWTTGQPIRLEGVALSLGALAFFVGFSVEVVFRLVDILVRAVADRIGRPSG